MEPLGPYLVPIFGMMIPIVAIIGGLWNQAHTNRLKAEQRMAMLARGIPLSEVEAVLKTVDCNNGRASNPMSSLGRARRTAVVLISVGLGLILFFNVLAGILGERDVLSGAAAGVIPLAIGIGFVVDYHLQKRELSRFGLEVEPDKHGD